MKSPRPSPSSASGSDSDDSTLLSALESSIDSDPSLGAYRAQRLQQLHAEHALAKQLRQDGHGTYNEIEDEKELMTRVTEAKWCVVHFYKEGFRRCGIMDGHLKTLSHLPTNIHTLFLRIKVDNAPFLVAKLGIRILPCVIAFVDSVIKDRIVGFEGLGGGGGGGGGGSVGSGAPGGGTAGVSQDNDDFSTQSLESRLLAAGVLSKTENASLLLQNRQKNHGNYNDDDDGGIPTNKYLRTRNNPKQKNNAATAEDEDEWDWDFFF